MRNGIRKRLNQGNKGFSLIELIIVIAIMAILVGIVAIAVVPNLERSRESKDLATLDNILSGIRNAVASAGVKAKETDTFKLSDCGPSSTDVVQRCVYEQLGDCSMIKFVSAAGKKATCITCFYDTRNNVASVEATGADACKYQVDSNGNKRPLKIVTNYF